jgi:DNA ligase-1
MNAFAAPKIFPTLYGVSSTGVTKVWKISVGQLALESVIITEHGQLDGKMQTSSEAIREGKNVGKANETSQFEQACLEAESKWKKKHDKNYTEVMPAPGAKIKLKLLPMLAQKYAKRKHKLVWPAFEQPKLNGVRCLVQRIGDTIIYWSRKAKVYKNFNLYMDPEFLSLMKDGEILDGEMYNHGDLTFQQLSSLIKDESTPDLEALKKYVKFHCYDRPDERGFKDRYYHDPKWFGIVAKLQYIVRVETVVVNDEEDVQKWHDKFVAEGYEGSIIRSGGDEAYRFQYKDNQLQKKKDFDDDEFPIVGCKEGTGPAEGMAIFKCQNESKTGGANKDGTFDVVIKSTHEERKQQWIDRKKYMGEELTVQYQNLSDEGIPIFPVGIALRDYE